MNHWWINSVFKRNCLMKQLYELNVTFRIVLLKLTASMHAVVGVPPIVCLDAASAATSSAICKRAPPLTLPATSQS